MWAPGVPRPTKPDVCGAIKFGDISHGKDLNPVIDQACPRSVGVIRSAVALSLALGIEFELHELDCEPFLHGYGEQCSDSELVFTKWQLSLKDLSGTSLQIPFYITKGDGILLLGNDVLSKCNILNMQQVVKKMYPGSTPNLTQEVIVPTYTTRDVERRTHLHIVHSQVGHFKTFFSLYR